MTGLTRSSANFANKAARSVSKGGKKITKATIPDEIEFGIADRLDKGTTSLQKRGKQIRLGPRLPQSDEGPVIPLPDEEALGLARRRSRSRRRGARASTVLTGGEDDTLG